MWGACQDSTHWFSKRTQVHAMIIANYNAMVNACIIN